MTYDYSRFSTLSSASGASIGDVAQDSFNDYWEFAPNKVSGTIDGVSKNFIIQNKTYIDASQNHDYVITETDSGLTYGSLVTYDSKTWLVVNMEKRIGNLQTHLAGRAHLCNRTFQIQTGSTDVQTGTDPSTGRPIVTSTPIYYTTPCIYRDRTSVGSSYDLGNAINIPQGHVTIEYKNTTDHVIEQGMTFQLDGLKYIIVNQDKSKLHDNIGSVNILAKEVTLDENA